MNKKNSTKSTVPIAPLVKTKPGPKYTGVVWAPVEDQGVKGWVPAFVTIIDGVAMLEPFSAPELRSIAKETMQRRLLDTVLNRVE